MRKKSRLSEVEKPWQMALTLAWEAHVGGNTGVGAVLTDPRGRVVAVGRNRVSDRKAPPGRLRSTAIAHAEIDILGQLVQGDYKNHTLWTTLESCALCSIAIVTSNVGRVDVRRTRQALGRDLQARRAQRIHREPLACQERTPRRPCFRVLRIAPAALVPRAQADWNRRSKVRKRASEIARARQASSHRRTIRRIQIASGQ